MENLLSDQRKLEKVTLKNDAFLNFVVNQENRIDTIYVKRNAKVCKTSWN